MANSEKDILIVPNRGSADSNPYIKFVCADSYTTAAESTVLMELIAENGGKLQFTNGEAVMFAIAAGIDGVTFRAVDQSGLDDIVITDGEIHLAPNGGNVLIGRGVTQEDSTALITIGGGLHFVGDSSYFELDFANPNNFNTTNKLYNVNGVLYFNNEPVSITGVDSAYVQSRQAHYLDSAAAASLAIATTGINNGVVDSSITLSYANAVVDTKLAIGDTVKSDSDVRLAVVGTRFQHAATFFNPTNNHPQPAVIVAGGDGDFGDILFELRGNTNGTLVEQNKNRSTGDTQFVVSGQGQTWINPPSGNVDSVFTGLANDVWLQVHGKTNLYGNTTVDGNLTVTGDIIADSQATIQVGAGGINFPNDLGGGSGDDAYISLSVAGETQTLTMAVTNDADDIINISTPSDTGLKHNNSTVLSADNFGSIFQAFNAVTADTDGTILADSDQSSFKLVAGNGIAIKQIDNRSIEIGTQASGGAALATENYVNGTSLVMALLFG